MTVPGFNVDWMRSSSRTRSPVRCGLTAATDFPTMPTASSNHLGTSAPRPPATLHPVDIALPSSEDESESHTHTTPSPEPDIPEVKILIMGATGSGKSTFINLASGSSLEVGKSLQSCTSTVQVAEAFELDGHRVALIDTPGFNDTTRSDTEILRTIVAFLGASYEKGDKLAGILYFHRISDLKMGGTQMRNFKMFRSLCGEEALKNVVIVTNMWSRVEPEVGEAREEELKEEDMFFKPALDGGAQMARHMNTAPSAKEIIRLLIESPPLPLQVQRELVDEHKDILDTSAGRELDQELSNEIKKHQEEIRVLTEEMEQAARDKDEETRVELEAETRRMHEEMRRFEEEARRLESEYRREREEFRVRLMEKLERERWEERRYRDYHHTTRTHYPPAPIAGGQFVDAPRRHGRSIIYRGLDMAGSAFGYGGGHF